LCFTPFYYIVSTSILLIVSKLPAYNIEAKNSTLRIYYRVTIILYSIIQNFAILYFLLLLDSIKLIFMTSLHSTVTRWFLILTTILFATTLIAQDYKQMMGDPSINFYDVVQAADIHFQTTPKGKGSGWKGYQRWFHANEYKYYPSGNRSTVSSFFSAQQFKNFQDQNPTPEALFNNGWEELGPSVMGQITGHYSPGLGRVESFYIDPSNTQKMYLGSRSGGFWKSIDGGTNWLGGATDFLPASGVNTIAASPTNSDSLLINIKNSVNSASHGIYRSIDGGNTWNLTSFNPSNLGWGGLGDDAKIYKIAFHPTIANKVYVGTSKGIYVSNDNLTSWNLYLSTSDITDIAFHPTNPNMLYVYDNYYWGANQNVVLVSTNGGINYTPSTTLSGNSDATCYLYTSPDCPNCVYVGSNNGIWKSSDNGNNFSFINNPTSGCYGGFAVSDLNVNNMLYGYVDTEMSTNEGTSFNQTTFWALGNTNGTGGTNQSNYNTATDYVHADLREAECINGVFYVASDGFLSKSIDNGISWEILSNGTGIREYYNLGVSQSNHYRTICGSQDNGTSIKHQNNWIEFTGGDGMEGIIHPLNDDWMISSYQYGSHRVTKDGGLTSSGGTPPSGSGYWITPMMYNPNDHMSVYHMSDTIHYSEDFGTSWVMRGTPSFTGDIKFATVAENNSNIIVVTRNEFIEKSIDGGNTFVSIKNNLPNYSITDVVFDPNDDDIIIVTYGRHQFDNAKVYISYNQGASWLNITSNLGNMPVRSVIIDHTDASNIYLGTEIGIYTKPMAGNSWSLYNPNLPNMSVKEMEVVWGSNTIRASTWGRGLWEYTLNGRQGFPTILKTAITDQPSDDTPKEGQDQFVTSSITYDNTLTSVYLEWSLNNPIFGNVITMSNIGGDEWKSDTPLPNSPAGTKLFFKVFAVGSAGDTTETYKFMYTVKPFAYCDASGESANGNLYLSTVNVANVGNNSGNDAYTYYANLPLLLNVDSTYNIALNANTSWSENDFGAWIDYNGNAQFEASEMIIADTNSGNFSALNFTVPSNANITDTLRLRVRLGYWDSPIFDPCGTTLGEVEDYPVVITNPVITSMNEAKNLTWKIYPNPTSSSFIISGIHEPYQLTINNALGQEIYSEYSVLETNKKVNMSSYVNGLFFITIKTATHIEVTKVLKK